MGLCPLSGYERTLPSILIAILAAPQEKPTLNCAFPKVFLRLRRAGHQNRPKCHFRSNVRNTLYQPAVHTIRKAFRRSVERAGLDPDQITPHVLRHTVVTHLVQAGVDLPTVQRISGHKTLSMVARYAHQSGTHIQEAMSKLEARLENAEPPNSASERVAEASEH